MRREQSLRVRTGEFRYRAVHAALTVVLSVLLTAACGGSSHPWPDRVVVVVVESLRHDYPDRIAMPNFERLAAEGRRARRLIPVFPTNSDPNLASLATGTVPAKHGVINNLFFFDAERSREFQGEAEEFDEALQVEPIWVTAERQGIPTAAVNWNAAAVLWRGVAPRRPSRVDDDRSDDLRVAEVERWLNNTGAASPQLLLVYLDTLDDVSHDHGPDAAATHEAVAAVDAAVGRIIRAIERTDGGETTTLFVLADHGMADVDRCIYLQAYIASLGFGARTLSSGAASNVYLDDPHDPLVVQAALQAADAGYDVYLPEEVPAGYDYAREDRVGDLVMVGRDGTYFRDREGRDRPIGPARLPGVHGFPHDHPDMAGAFVMWGRGVVPGEPIETVSILDVHPTISRLLGLDVSTNVDGRALLD